MKSIRKEKGKLDGLRNVKFSIISSFDTFFKAKCLSSHLLRVSEVRVRRQAVKNGMSDSQQRWGKKRLEDYEQSKAKKLV